jgi:sterol-4alpha-carboxylate 3-dehydrogenase (decarboxylating)
MSKIPERLDLSSHHLLLTGGTGFLGGHIVHALHSSFPGLKITVFDLPPRKNAPKSLTPLDPSIDVIHGDITSTTSLASAFKQLSPPATIVIHSAGVVPTGNDRYRPSSAVRSRVWEINVTGTKNVMAAAKESGVSTFVYTGSCTTITDDNCHNYPNMSEETRTVGETMIYGKSKVSISWVLLELNTLIERRNVFIPNPLKQSAGDIILAIVFHTRFFLLPASYKKAVAANTIE